MVWLALCLVFVVSVWLCVVFGTINPPGSHPLGLQLGVCGTSDENGVLKTFRKQTFFQVLNNTFGLG